MMVMITLHFPRKKQPFILIILVMLLFFLRHQKKRKKIGEKTIKDKNKTQGQTQCVFLGLVPFSWSHQSLFIVRKNVYEKTFTFT